MRFLVACGLLAAGPAVSAAQMTAAAAYDSVQRIRAEADTLLAADPAAAVTRLHRALDFLARPAIRDLAQGWPYLLSRAPNVWWDVAIAATLAADSAAALTAIERTAETGGSSIYLQWLETDSVVRRWKNHPRVQAAAAGWRRQRAMTGDSAFATGYRASLPEAERLAGLSLLWAEVRFGFPDFAIRAAVDWDSLYLAYLPQVSAAATTYDYYRTLMRFVAALGDSHTNVYFPAAISRTMGRPPVQTTLVQGRVIVTGTPSPTVEGLGLRVGDEIVTIDGTAVRTYAEREIAPYQSAATPQDREVRLYSYFLLQGPRDQPVRLGIRHADGSAAEVSLPRTGYRDVRPGRRPVTDSILPGNVGYLRIATFGLDSVGVWARASMQRLIGTRALILDLRENDGGNTTNGPLAILARDSTPTTAQRIRNYSALYRARGLEPQPLELGHGWIRPDPKLHYDGPVVLLIGPRTFSAGEDFAAAFDLMNRGTIVGEASGGNTGQPLAFPLPGGGLARVRTKHDYYADGREFLFRGIQPGIVVRPTVGGVRAGRDEVLEAALSVVTTPR
ncbi:MAG: S41 family peptidase [Gemmatimonadales bacterium]